MSAATPARILRVHFNENDKYDGKPLCDAMLQKCRAMKIAGATVFRGLEGFGESTALHKQHLVTHDQPLILVVVDTSENIERLVPVVEQMLYTGVIAISEVDVIRMQNATSTPTT